MLYKLDWTLLYNGHLQYLDNVANYTDFSIFCSTTLCNHEDLVTQSSKEVNSISTLRLLIFVQMIKEFRILRYSALKAFLSKYESEVWIPNCPVKLAWKCTEACLNDLFHWVFQVFPTILSCHFRADWGPKNTAAGKIYF